MCGGPQLEPDRITGSQSLAGAPLGIPHGSLKPDPLLPGAPFRTDPSRRIPSCQAHHYLSRAGGLGWVSPSKASLAVHYLKQHTGPSGESATTPTPTLKQHTGIRPFPIRQVPAGSSMVSGTTPITRRPHLAARPSRHFYGRSNSLPTDPTHLIPARSIWILLRIPPPTPHTRHPRGALAGGEHDARRRDQAVARGAAAVDATRLRLMQCRRLWPTGPWRRRWLRRSALDVSVVTIVMVSIVSMRSR